jgi:hypothetical protein
VSVPKLDRSLPPRLRWSILRRDEFRCTYCGRAASQGITLQVDHIISWADGGSDDPANLTTACDDCNLGKGAQSLMSIEFAVRVGEHCFTRLAVALIRFQFGLHDYRASYAFLGGTGHRLPPRDRRLDRLHDSTMAAVWHAWESSLPERPDDLEGPSPDLANPKGRRPTDAHPEWYATWVTK